MDMPQFHFTRFALLMAVYAGVLAGFILGLRKGRSSIWLLAPLVFLPPVAGGIEVAQKQDIWFAGWVISSLNVVLGLVPPAALFVVVLFASLAVSSLFSAAIGLLRRGGGMTAHSAAPSREDD
jgi:hypothetical protein